LFTQSSPVHELLLQAFPFPSTLGVVTLHLLFQACVFIYSSCGKWAFFPLLWSFPPTTAFTSFPAPGCWARTPAPALSGQARLVYLQFCEGFPSLPLQHSGRPTFFAMCLYCSYCLLLSFSFFPGWGLVCPGDYADLAQGCLWECRQGAGVWRWPGGPPGFSIKHEVEILCAGWRCGGVKVLPLLGGLACEVCLQRLSKISL
jgi:hypothetical protein